MISITAAMFVLFSRVPVKLVDMHAGIVGIRSLKGVNISIVQTRVHIQVISSRQMDLDKKRFFFFFFTI